jgi:hypothetical protein
MLRLFRILCLFTLLTAVAGGQHWLTIEELSERLNIPVGTLREWRIRRYGPPGTKLGRGRTGPLRYRLSSVEAWEAAQEQADAARPARRRARATRVSA